jgi:protein-disulfide isomerase
MLADRVLGSDSAPITMIDYSSLNCPHCANFTSATLPSIKLNYIDTGKVRLVTREFPLNNGSALSAAMLARCAGDRYSDAVSELYASQDMWASASDPTSILKSAVYPVMSGAVADACLADTALRNGLWAIRTSASSNGIQATPTFVINGQPYVGDMPYASFDAIFKSLLPG